MHYYCQEQHGQVKNRAFLSRKMIDAGKVQLINYSTEFMLADTLRKQLAQNHFSAFVNAMMLENTRLDQSRRFEDHEAAESRSD